MPEDITVDKDKFDALLFKIARSKPTSQGQIKTMMASAKASKPKKGQAKGKTSRRAAQDGSV